MTLANQSSIRWYDGVTRYQWLVLVIASLGWVFDVFEGQIFVASMNEAMPDLLEKPIGPGVVAYYNSITFGAFLLGGALGGVFFGILSDRIGRKRTMTFTILMYSAFTFVSALSAQWWHLAVFRFLVAMGVGGEWAVASAMVAEVFPQRARAWSLAIFHASSVLGTLMAVAAGFFIIARSAEIVVPVPGGQWVLGGWRLGFVLGVAPALLIIWIRTGLREPESWVRVRAHQPRTLGRIGELFSPGLLPRTLIGVGLAAVGLATFWGTHIYGKDLPRRLKERSYLAEIIAETSETGASQALQEAHRDARATGTDGVAFLRKRLQDSQEMDVLLRPFAQQIKQWEMLGMLLLTVGGGLGLVSFGPLCEWLGRRGAFLLFHVGGLGSSLVLFQAPLGLPMLLVCLPIFGFLTLGMHAGYAVYFPELFPTRLRGTGGGFCFNVGRILAAPILYLSGWLQRGIGIISLKPLPMENAASLLSLLFIVGILLLWPAPETKGQQLPE